MKLTREQAIKDILYVLSNYCNTNNIWTAERLKALGVTQQEIDDATK